MTHRPVPAAGLLAFGLLGTKPVAAGGFDYDSEKRRPLIRHGYWRLMVEWARRDMRSRYTQSRGRMAWSVWQPVSLVLLNGLFFGVILDVTAEPLPYLSFIISGVTVWRFFSLGVGATTLLSDNADVMAKTYFPREILPLAFLSTGLVDLTAMTVVLILAAWLQGVGITVTVVALPAVFVVLLLVTTAVTLLLCTVAVFVRDVTFGLPLLNQVLFLGTPIMYPVEEVPARFRWLYELNPLAVTIEATRDVVLRHIWPNWAQLGIHGGIAAIAILVALRYVRAVEDAMVDVA